MNEKEYVPDKLIQYLAKNGTQYKPAPLPRGLKRGEMGRCFDNSMLAALKSRYQYVEGMTWTTKSRQWMLHAWVTDGEHAFDLTWYAVNVKGKEVPIPGVYIGLPMDMKAVGRFVQATEYQSVIANAWRDPEKARAVLPPDFPILTP